MGARLAFACTPGGGLAIGARRRYGRVWLRLLTDHAELFVAGMQPVPLPWEGVNTSQWYTPVSGWQVTYWSNYRGEAYGIGIRLGGEYERAATAAMRAARPPWWRRLQQWLSADSPYGSVVPLTMSWVVSMPFRSSNRELTTLTALTDALSQRTDLRQRLGEPHRCALLARDLAVGILDGSEEYTGRTRDQVDIVTALHQAGYRHPFDRPLAPGDHAPLADVIADVGERLAANPYRRDRPPPSDEVLERTIRRAYLDIKPWPFAALVDDGDGDGDQADSSGPPLQRW